MESEKPKGKYEDDWWWNYMKINKLRYNILPIGTEVIVDVVLGERNLMGKIDKQLLPGYVYSNTCTSDLRYRVRINSSRCVVVDYRSVTPVNNINFNHLIKYEYNKNRESNYRVIKRK